MTTIGDLLTLLTARPALIALVTAGIGGFVAFVVAGVNLWSARGLERSKARRAYRAEIVRPTLEYSRFVSSYLGTQKMRMFSITDWSDLGPQTLTWLNELQAHSEMVGTIYLSDREVEATFRLLMDLQTEFAELVNGFKVQPPAYDPRSILINFIASIHSACSTLEVAAEAYIFGGWRTRFRALRKRRRLEKIVEGLPNEMRKRIPPSNTDTAQVGHGRPDTPL
jgi:hypothetical protein